MELDRRTMMAGAAALVAAGPGLARKPAAAGWYDRAIIIDGLGGLGDPYAPEEQLRMSDRAWNEVVETGVTVVRDTVMPVGNVADDWGEYKKAITVSLNFLNANPDRLLLVRSAADILKAKREKKLAWVLGTQDSSMVGPELDRLAEMKKDGIMTVQLTYNLANLSGATRALPISAATRSAGSNPRSSCSTSATGARRRWPRPPLSRSAPWSSATPVPERWSITRATPATR
jgi:membrane dipeptidase